MGIHAVRMPMRVFEALGSENPTGWVCRSGLEERVQGVLQKEVARLSPADIRCLVSQGIGLELVLPMALDLLKHDLLAEGDMEGDILRACLNQPIETWRHFPAHLKALFRLVKDAGELPEELASDRTFFLNRISFFDLKFE